MKAWRREWVGLAVLALPLLWITDVYGFFIAVQPIPLFLLLATRP